MRVKFYLLLPFLLLVSFLLVSTASADTSDCKTSSTFSVTLKSVNGSGIEKLKVEVYQEDYDNGDFSKPIVGKKVLSGTTDSSGKWATTSFKPTQNKYIVKVYDKNADNGDFWFFGEYASCGSDVEVKETLPRLTVVLRDANNNLIKDADVSLYSLHTDIDGNPIVDKAYLVGTSKPSTSGTISYYVAQNIPKLSDKNGAYFLQVTYNKQSFNFPNVRAGNTDITYEYVLSGVKLNVNSAGGKPLSSATVNVYAQNQDLSLGSKLYSTKTNAAGEVYFDYPAGVYAFSVTDDYKQENIFNNVVVASASLSPITLTTNYTKFYLASVSSEAKGVTKRTFKLYSLTAGSDGSYYKNKQLGSFQMTDGSDTAVSLASGPYLAVYSVDNKEYGTAFMAANSEQRVALKIASSGVINSGGALKINAAATPVSTPTTTVTPTKTTTATTKVTSSKLSGYIVSVVNNGGLWYISNDNRRFRLDGGYSAFDVIKSLSVGITDADISKFPVALSTMYGVDTDGDGLSDSLETALGTKIDQKDSDGDKYSDFTEVQNNYNPLSRSASKINTAFSSKNRGRLFIQVQNAGQLWYISPINNKRYFLFDADNITSALSKIAISVTWPQIAYLPAGN